MLVRYVSSAAAVSVLVSGAVLPVVLSTSDSVSTQNAATVKAKVKSKAKTKAVKLPWSMTAAHVKKYRLSNAQIVNISKAVSWARSGKAKKVRHRESKGNYKINTGNGYYGAYQYSASTWRNKNVGGKKWASLAHKAPAWAQDYVTYNTVKKYGWSPWGG